MLGLLELRNELDSYHDGQSIKALCVKSGDKFQFECFSSALPLEAIKTEFDIMFHQYHSAIFRRIWEAQMKRVAKSKFNIEGIKTQIWDPVFLECKQLLESLYDRTIPLSHIDYYFQTISNRTAELKQLWFGIELCITGKLPNSHPPWITVVVGLMDQYWSLLRLAEAAKTVLIMKDTLGLADDFSVINTLAQQVRIN